MRQKIAKWRSARKITLDQALQMVDNRTAQLARLLDLKAPQIILEHQMRMIREAQQLVAQKGRNHSGGHRRF